MSYFNMLKMTFGILLLSLCSFYTSKAKAKYLPSPFGKCCEFPFRYQEVLHTSCITTRSTLPWCSTTFNYDVHKSWGHCVRDTNCTRGCTRTTAGYCCVFPFDYAGNRRYTCIKEHHHRPWCATTDNWRRDRKWGNCVQENGTQTFEGNDVRFALAVKPFENCNSVCARYDLVCTTTNHGFPYDSALNVMKDLNITCNTDPSIVKWFGRYRYSDNPGYFVAGANRGQCFGFRNIPAVINCDQRDNENFRRVCPCVPAKALTTVKSNKTNETSAWSPWGQWRGCSRTCGGGYKWRMRKCNTSGLCVGGRDVARASCNRFDCVEVKVRLQGGRTKYEGRIQVLYKNEWGSICYQYGRPKNGRVVCRMLGYRDAIRYITASTPSSGRIWLQTVLCHGNELSIAHCAHRGWGVVSSKCTHADDAFVTCQPPTSTTQTPVKPSSSFPTSATIGVVLGVSCLVIVVVASVVWYFKRYSFWTRCLNGKQKESFSLELGTFPDKWEICREQIVLEGLLGQGAFGKVHKATMSGAPDWAKQARKISKPKSVDDSLPVAVKTVQGSTDEQLEEFVKEIELMKTVGFHPNIVNMIGCCTTSDPLLLVVEFVSHGDLLHFLRDRRNALSLQNQAGKEDAAAVSSNSNDDNITTEEQEFTVMNLLSYAWQIAKGMEYLESKGFVHRDLAARNILIGEGNVAKVSDFGLTRQLQQGDNFYHCKSNRKLPVKWMSPEAIYDMTFTVKSDVWAFGVILWELATMGGTPYPSLSNHEVLKYLKRGHRMDKPSMCSDEFYDLMTLCWKDDPEDRPSFDYLQSKLEQAIIEKSPYLELSGLDPSSNYYNLSGSSGSSSGQVP